MMHRKRADPPIKATPEMVAHMNAALMAGDVKSHYFDLNKRCTVTWFARNAYGGGAGSCSRCEVERLVNAYMRTTIQALADAALVATAAAVA